MIIHPSNRGIDFSLVLFFRYKGPVCIRTIFSVCVPCVCVLGANTRFPHKLCLYHAYMKSKRNKRINEKITVADGSQSCGMLLALLPSARVIVARLYNSPLFSRRVFHLRMQRDRSDGHLTHTWWLCVCVIRSAVSFLLSGRDDSQLC